MALRAFYFIRTLTKALTYYFINRSQRHLLFAIENNQFGGLFATEKEPISQSCLFSIVVVSYKKILAIENGRFFGTSIPHYETAKRSKNSLALENFVRGTTLLEQRQYKNDSIQSKIIPRLKLPRFFTTYTVRGKERQFQNWNHFWLNGVVLILSLL